MTQYVKKLPAVFQTVTEKKFFDATFDQVLSKKDSDYLAGYLGRRDPGSYNPISDFYLPEPSKNRTWWQLEPTAFSRNEDSTKTNLFFYEDLLDNIEYYGGNTLNQDRLFNSEYYSYGPPIDYDMFTNYHDYYWVEQRLPVITITGVMASDIIGQSTFTTPPSATPANFTLSSGMSVILTDDPDYIDAHTVENFGGCKGLQLVPYFTDITAGAIFEFLPWDGILELSTGRTIDNSQWDILTWDTQYQPSSGDYITIQRGSINRNAWSRTNKWYHIDTIKAVLAETGLPFPPNSTRALRPIIQFNPDLILYKSGTQFNSEIDYGFGDYSAGGPSILISEFQGQLISTLNSTYSMSMAAGDLVCFFNDDTEIDINVFPWDTISWDTDLWDEVDFTATVNKFIFEVVVEVDGTVSFSPHTSWQTPLEEGDIVIVKEDGPGTSAQAGETWYYESGTWAKAFNDKISLNQPPLFQLYDHLGVPIDDVVKYPNSTFRGNKIFSYKINPEPGATVDPVLKFPILYTGLGQYADIVFQNNLIVDRYEYGFDKFSIDGYYYYIQYGESTLYNSWNLYQPCPCDDIIPPPPCNCLDVSKQRVIDKYVVGFGTEYQFKLSVTPYGYPASPDLIVSVNGLEVKSASETPSGYTFAEINNSIYVDLTSYLSSLLTTTQTVQPVVEIQTYTHGLLDPAATGYYQIPQQLEANPNQEEISEISGSNLIQHFTSIIGNQIDFSGTAFGGPNNYRDSRKNQSVGQYILQNTSPLLKAMLVSPQGDLSFIDAVRFSNDEYSKFKNRYLKIAQQLINQGFNPVQYKNKTVIVSAWVEEILKTINVSKEFSNAFAYSYMIANGSPFASETLSGPISGVVTLTNYVDLSDPKNALYIYEVDSSGQETLLLIGKDYEISSTNLAIDVDFINPVSVGSTVYIALYKNPLPAYIPSTPSKIGAYPVYVPRMEWDTTYVTPTWVIIGHDGSKTIAYGTPSDIDYRDQLLLELEKRIYNLIQLKYRDEYCVPLRIESVKSTFFREARYSREEYLSITSSYINKWSAKNRANYRANDWDSLSGTTTIDKLWKLYNYSDAVNTLDEPLNLPGNWKGIFQYMYGTYQPDTRPWEMLGFSEEPSWWRYEYGNPLTNLEGQDVWPSNAGIATGGVHELYEDIEAGIIRQGPCAIYDPLTLAAQPQEIWAKPGLSAYIPVDIAGELRPVLDVNNISNSLFGIDYSGNPYDPFDGYDNEWAYGDGGPVEQAWMSTSAYAFSVQEFLYLMRPAAYGEYFWDTSGTELSPGFITVPDSTTPVRTNTNWQYVQNDTFTSDNPFFSWMRPKNKDQKVHAENIDGNVQIRYGYQRWISDRILFLGKDITSTFAQKIRTLDVNLANKLSGFTNKDTTNTYIESIAPGSSTNGLIIPSNNFEVILHKSPVVETYNYSGVIVRALEDGTFMVYGYDLLSSEFTVLDRSTSKLIDISIGGTPAEFIQFQSGSTYKAGDIVRYNGVYYLSNEIQTVVKFADGAWTRLKTLPTVGGISVSYKPVSLTTTTKISYGTVLKSVQEVFDMLIGWGAYLESKGWQFIEVNQDTNQLSDWLYAGKQFLFWLNTDWAPDASIQLSPLANKATLVVNRGYPNDVETMSNGVYSILDRYGVAISPINTITDREGQMISVEPTDLSVGGIYYLQVNVSETEHVLIFDNETSFNDIIYSPLLRARQQRLRFNGFRSNGWYGKMEAPGYLVIDNQLVPNYDTIVTAMRYYYDPNVLIDNSSLEDLGRHLIGYESKSYLDNLQVSNDVQYLFYQGAIRQKGTKQALTKLFRSTKIQSDNNIEIFEEWALKLGEFGNTVEQVSTEFILRPEQDTGNVIVARLNYVPSEIGFVRKINILNAENSYTIVPAIVISAPDAGTPEDRQAKAYAVLDATGIITRIDMSDVGYGYTKPPSVSIVSLQYPINVDSAYAVWQGKIINDENNDNIIDIDIDETNIWTVRPSDPEYSLNFPTTEKIEYFTPNAGYVNFNDVDFYSFDKISTVTTWGSAEFNPAENNTLWIANTFTEDWAVYKIINPYQYFDVVANDAGDLSLRTLKPYKIAPQFSLSGDITDFGNIIGLQVFGAEAIVLGPSKTATGTVQVSGNAVADANIISGSVSSINLISGGAGYTSTPSVVIEPPVLEPASASAEILNGNVVSISINDPGDGYASATVTFTPPNLSTAVASISIDNGTINSISVVNPGSGYSSAPVVSITPPILGTATATAYVDTGGVISIDVVNAGSGYASAPHVSISDISGSGAVAIAHISNGIVVSVEIINAGTSYTNFPTIIIEPPDGQGAAAIANITNGGVSTITITSVGTGYSAPPTITVADPVGQTATGTPVVTNGQISSIIIDNPGSGYSIPPSVIISAPNGTQASAAAALTLGSVSSVSVISPGSGYSFIPEITISGSTGSGTVASATITDPGAGYTTPPTVTISGDGTGAEFTANIVDGQVVSLNVIDPGQGYTFASITFSDPAPSAGEITGIEIKKSGAGYVSAPTVTIVGDGTGATAEAVIVNGSISEINLITPGSGYTTATVNISYPETLVGNSNYAISFEFNQADSDNNSTYYYYDLLTLDGTPVSAEDIPEYEDLSNLLLFKKLRFWTESEVPLALPYISVNDKIWVDGADLSPQAWTVYNVAEITPSLELVAYRRQEPLINSSLFENSEVFSNTTTDSLVRLPVYDPFKGILPALAKQNLSYVTLRDPARYNVTTDPRLFSDNITFSENQVGQLWWDISTAKYVYYEQPQWLNADGTYGEDATDNLVYRRDNWGKMFPGSTVSIYEWTRSLVPPDQYTGSGIPKDVNTYVQVVNINKFTNIQETVYYFWVLNPTDIPNNINRTIAASNVALILQSPRSQGLSFFAPVQETEINTSYMFYNIQSILSYKGNNVQINYRQSERNDQPHTQWAFFREGDEFSTVSDQFWNKMVDSICAYTKVLPVSNEYNNSILVYEDIPTAWDMFPWDSSTIVWDEEVTNSADYFGEILPVPDPTLSEKEKYGIMYRPRQGMFVNLEAARKVFAQAANNLLKYIPVRDDNPSWDANVSTDIYWTYTNWYKAGYEDIEPTNVYQTLANATTALANNELQVGDIVQVIDGTVDGRFVLYAVMQINPNISTLSLEEVGIENSAIKLLDTVYTTVNKYNLSIELRELLGAFRTEVMVDENLVDQNKLYFSLINYVLSEQKAPDWVFKTSYIYIKENDIPLVQDRLFIPNQIDNVVQYINDAKPYHTQIRDYTSKYTAYDIAAGTAIDTCNIKTTLEFGPRMTGWDMNSWDNNLWDLPEVPWITPAVGSLDAKEFVYILEQFVSGDSNFDLDTISVPLTSEDISKKGYSNLYPYTFSYLGNPPTQNNPQTFIAPESIIAVKADDIFLLAGHDFYAEYNSIDSTYTIYFFNDPSSYTTLEAFILFDGGNLLNVQFETYRNELALGFPSDDLVVNVDTKLPVNDVSSVVGPSWAPATVAPYVGWGASWDALGDTIVSDILISEGGISDVPWDTPLTPLILDYTISSKENKSEQEGISYLRNNDSTSGILVNNLDAPTVETENIQVITVSALSDIFPAPSSLSLGVIWIDGERIEYKEKELIAPGVWELRLVRRGTHGTAPSSHLSMVPSVPNPLVTVPNKVWVERNNLMPITSDETVWAANNSLPDLSTEESPGVYTSVTSVPLGGLWYSETVEAQFLKEGPGKAIE